MRDMKRSSLLLGIVFFTAALSAQDFRAVRVEQGPHIDGLLTDPMWQAVPSIDGFRMVEPRPG
jgi:hypothetical protein